MPSSTINYYNFYFRYLWSKDDFSAFQTGLSDSFRGSFDGLLGGAIVDGLAVTKAANTTVEVQAGTALSVSGKLLYLSEAVEVALTKPVSNQERVLLVLRAKTVDNTSITDPTDPNSSVFLKTQQTCEVVAIRGTPSATPSYPSKLTDDVVICGVRLDSTDNLDGDQDFDLSVREIVGKNRPSQRVDQSIYDDRLRPYRNGTSSVGIKPSIVGYNASPATEVRSPLGFSQVDQAAISAFPRDSFGNFTPLDTFLNLNTGAITGGDEQSANFTPATPGAADRYRVSLVQIDTDDELSVKHYGVDSTSKFGAYTVIYDRDLLPDPGRKLICYLIAYSAGGSTWQDLDVIDARHPGNVIHNGNFGAANIVTTGTASFGGILTVLIGGTRESSGGGNAGHFQNSASTSSDCYVGIKSGSAGESGLILGYVNSDRLTMRYDSATGILAFLNVTTSLWEATALGAITLGPDTFSGTHTVNCSQFTIKGPAGGLGINFNRLGGQNWQLGNIGTGGSGSIANDSFFLYDNTGGKYVARCSPGASWILGSASGMSATPLTVIGYSTARGSAATSDGEIKLGSQATSGARFQHNDSGVTTTYLENLYDDAATQLQIRMRAAGTPVRAFQALGSGVVSIGPDAGTGSGTTVDALEHSVFGALRVVGNPTTAGAGGDDVECDFVLPYVAGAAYLIIQTVYETAAPTNCQTALYLAVEGASGTFNIATSAIKKATTGSGVTVASDPLMSRSGNVVSINISTGSTLGTTCRQSVIRLT